MQTKTIAIAGAADRHLSLKASFLQIKNLARAAAVLAFIFTGFVPITKAAPLPAVILENISGAPTGKGTAVSTAAFSAKLTGVSSSNFSVCPPGGVSNPAITSVAVYPRSSSMAWYANAQFTGSGGHIRLKTDNSAHGLPSRHSYFLNMPLAPAVRTESRFALNRIPMAGVPTVTIGSPSATSVSSGPVTFPVTYTGATSIPSLGGYIVVNTTGTVGYSSVTYPGGPYAYTVSINGLTGNGTVSLTIYPGASQNSSGDDGGAGPSATVIVDNPIISTSGTLSALGTTAGTASPSESFHVSGAGLTTGNLTVTAPSGFDVSANNSTWSGSGGSFTIAETGTISSTPVYVRLDAGDAANTSYSGNVSVSGGGATTATVAIPSSFVSAAVNTTTSISSNNNPSYSTAPNNSVAFTATVTSSGTVNGGTVTFTSNGSAIGGGTDVPVNSSGEATVTTSFNTAGVYTIVATYNGTSIFASSSSSHLNQQVNLHPTTINSIIPNSAYSNAGSIQFTVNFGASVTGLSTSNFSLTTTGAVGGASIASVSPSSGSTYTVTVNTGTGDGAIGLNLANAAGLTPGISTTLPFTGGTTTIDKTLPVVTIGAPSAPMVSGSIPGSVSYAVTYTDINFGSSNLTVSGITLNATGTATGTVGLIGSGASYLVTISNITGIGTLGISIGAGHASDMAGNTDAGAGRSETVNVQIIPPPMSYSSPQVYPINAVIAPLSPTNSVIVNTAATTPANSQSLAVDNSGNAFEIVFPGANIAMFPAGGGAPVPAYNGNASGANLSVAAISATSGTLVFGSGSQVEAMDYSGGTFQAPVTIGTSTPGGLIVAAAHPASGPDVVVVFKGAGSQIYFTARTGGIWSAPAAIPNALEGPVMALNTYQGGLKMAYVGQDFNLYYSIYSGGVWSAVAPWSTPSTNPGPVSNFALDAQGNLWFIAGSALDEMVPGSAVISTIPPQAALANIAAIAFDSAGNFYANCAGTKIERADIGGGFQVSPGLPAGLGIDSNTGLISGTPTAATAATDYTVTATAGSSKLSAIVNIQILSTNANLSNLSLSNGTLSPVFASGTTSYTATVANSVTTMTVTPTTADPNATVTINGASVTSGTASGPIALAEGQNTITTVVTAQDGVTTETYTVTVTRPLSSLAKLTNLKISRGTLTPVFASATTSYTAAVANGVTSITVTPIAANANATVQVNGTTVALGSASPGLPLAVGPNTITIAVTAEDGVTKKTYTVVVTEAASVNDNLSALKPGTGTMSPIFSPATSSYTETVANTVTTITITPTTADPTATVKVNGATVTSGTASTPISLIEGTQTVITTVVTAQDGTTAKTYTVTVTRSPSANANLATLGQSIGGLTPGFSSTTTGYTLNSSNATATITLKPVSSDANATIKVNGTAVTSGTVTGPIALAEGGQTVITTIVTAQNGTTIKTYTLTVTRPVSTNASLSALKLSSGTLSPAFATATTSYTASVINSVSSITITPTTTDANATVKVNGIAVTSGTVSTPITLAEGAQTVITTAITAQDGSTTKTYTVTATRAPSANANLSTLGQSVGGLTPAFSSTTISYTENVSNATASMTLKPVSGDANATIKVNSATVASGTLSGPIALAPGPNTITTVVTAQNGTTTKTYTLTVTRASGSADSYSPGISVTKPTETATLADDGIQIHQGVSPNGDGINDFLQIDNISQYPNNKLSIMNRNGQLIFETIGYDNSSKIFDGHSNKNGQMQLPGTYFYQLDYAVNGITKHKTGFIVLKY